MNEETLQRLHEQSRRNREALRTSSQCGCFYCVKIFPSTIVVEFVRGQRGGDKNTAQCPHCQIDAVIPISDGSEVTLVVLREMRRRWFETYSEADV